MGIVAGALAGCGADLPPTRFELLAPERTGVTFANELLVDAQLNPYTYKGYFNGGGVGLGDLDGDGLLDIILTGNRVDNRVYRNLGDFRFEDVTRETDLGGEGVWSTGVAVADVDGDGLLDVYLCKSGPELQPNRRNELRLNRGGGRFVDVAREAGVADLGYGTHATFLDYDRDGDLDLYLLNNSLRAVGGFDLRPGLRERPSRAGANKLLRNGLIETGELRFTDVSAEAGIYRSDIGFGLGVAVGDVNDDLWPDLYVSNDFFERDYLYVNRGGGRFAERLTELVPETSAGAMGADMADLDGDGRPEIFVTEMLPGRPDRYRSKAQFESWTRRRVAEAAGYHRQYSRNTLLSLTEGGFVDVGRQVGVEATDWSWGALLADFDNDGARDLFVANGVYKDLLDQDYLNFVAPGQTAVGLAADGEALLRLLDSMPGEPLPDRAFRNLGEPFGFADVAEEWGFGRPTFSNGAAYGDLDNDGDLDLVVNVLGEPALLYRNRTAQEPGRRAGLLIALRDTFAANTAAVGSRVTVVDREGSRQTAFATPSRGFMSTVDPRVHFALARERGGHAVVVEWSGGGTDTFQVDPGETVVTLTRTDPAAPGPVRDLPAAGDAWRALGWRHEAGEVNDFDVYPLLPEMVSRIGPPLAAWARSDTSALLFVGGGAGQPSVVYEVDGDHLTPLACAELEADSALHDAAATWVGRGTGAVQLLVWSGVEGQGEGLIGVRAYDLVEGTGPNVGLSRARTVCGFGEDGSQPGLPGDFAVAESAGTEPTVYAFPSHRPGRYGELVTPFAVVADAAGGWTAEAMPWAPGGTAPARVTAAVSLPGDERGAIAIATASDFGPVSLHRNRGRFWETIAVGPTGRWRSLAYAGGGGDSVRLVAGNVGTNHRLRSTAAQPLELVLTDLGEGGEPHRIMTAALTDTSRRVLAGFREFAAEAPSIRRRYTRYAAYARADAGEVLAVGEAEATRLPAEELGSGVLAVAREGGRFGFRPFGARLQRSRTEAIAPLGAGCFWLAGNFEYAKPEYGAQFGSYGEVVRVGETPERGGGSATCRGGVPPLDGQVSAAAVAGSVLVAARAEDSLAVLRLDRLGERAAIDQR